MSTLASRLSQLDSPLRASFRRWKPEAPNAWLGYALEHACKGHQEKVQWWLGGLSDQEAADAVRLARKHFRNARAHRATVLYVEACGHGSPGSLAFARVPYHAARLLLRLAEAEVRGRLLRHEEDVRLLRKAMRA